MGNVTATLHKPVGDPRGMVNWAVTTYWLTCAAKLPEMLLIITLDGGTLLGGAGGAALGSRLNVTSNPLTPCVADVGDTLRIPLVTVVSPNAKLTNPQTRNPTGNFNVLISFS